MSARKIFEIPISSKAYDEIKPVLEAYFGLQESFINDIFVEGFQELNESLPPEKKYSAKDMFKGMAEMREQGYHIKFLVFDADQLYELIQKYNLHWKIHSNLPPVVQFKLLPFVNVN